MPRVRAVTAPRGGTQDVGGGRSYRILSGSMGAAGLPETNASLDSFEAPQADDAAWQADVRQREAALGLLPAPVQRTNFYPTSTPELNAPGNLVAPTIPVAADLAGLPDHWTLSIEKKGEYWKITAPQHHSGMYIVHKDLFSALADAPGSLAMILRLDGALPAKPTRKRKP